MKKKKALWKLFRCESRITSLLWDDRLYRRDKCQGKGLPRYEKYSFLSKWFVFIWIKALLRNIDVSQQRYTLFQMWKYGTENICSKRRKTLNYIFSNKDKNITFKQSDAAMDINVLSWLLTFFYVDSWNKNKQGVIVRYWNFREMRFLLQIIVGFCLKLRLEFYVSHIESKSFLQKKTARVIRGCDL